MMKVLLAALDSQYIHTNLAVRSLAQCCPAGVQPIIREYTINQPLPQILFDLVRQEAQLVAFSCYIWNIEAVLRLCEDYRAICPQATILLGGPEVSFDAKALLAANRAVDMVLCGEGEEIFPRLLRRLQQGASPEGLPGVVYRQGDTVLGDESYQTVADLASLPFPYAAGLPSKGRIVYYESSRGCPFGCSYCLSGAIKGGVRELPLSRVKQELSFFDSHKVDLVKFTDRTFNANPSRAKEIVRYLLSNTHHTRFHFEIGADLLDDELLDLLASAPPERFQVEAGIQSCNPLTLRQVVRHTDLDRLQKNVAALISSKRVHVHLDLIAGLPYEDLPSFARSFNWVYRLNPHQLQLGFLKLLKGSALQRQASALGLVCRRYPPYEVLKSDALSGEDLAKLKDVETVVERYYNSGRAVRSLGYLLDDSSSNPFVFYRGLAEFCARTGRLYRPLNAGEQLQALGEYVQTLPLEACVAEPARFWELLALDYLANGGKGSPPNVLAPLLSADVQPLVRQLKNDGKITAVQTRRARFVLLKRNPFAACSTDGGYALAMIEPERCGPLDAQAGITFFPIVP